MNPKRRTRLFLALAVAACAALPSCAYAFDIVTRVNDESAEVLGGDRVYFEVDIKYPENRGRVDLRIKYQIADQEGNVVAEAQSLRAIETQISFIDYVVVPKDADAGLYDLTVVADDYEGNLDKDATVSFRVLKGADEIRTYFYILLGMIVLVGALVMVQIFLMNRRRPA